MVNHIIIKQAPRWLTMLPMVPKKIAFAIAPYIFLPKWQYQEYISGSPSVETQGTIAHESVHIRREYEQGVLLFGLRYIFSKKFRFREEVLAITEQMKIYKAGGGEFDRAARAEMLAGSIYGYCANFQDAKKELDTIWESL